MPIMLKRKDGSITRFRNAEFIPAFYILPKSIIDLCGTECQVIPRNPKLLYGLMLDRMQLSAINGWCDKNGEVFIFYTIAETSEMIGCGHDKATRLQRELEKYNLLRRKYQGKGRPARLYVLPIPKTRIRSP